MTAKKKKSKGSSKPADTSDAAPDHNDWEPEHLFGQEKTNVESLDVAESLQRQLDTARTKLTRLTAEFDNFRKRSREEREKTLLYANESLANALLPAFDDFERALQHMESSDQEPEEAFEGIRLIVRQIQKSLEQKGVRRFEAVGERFDPYMHEAVQMVPREGVPPGTVVEEFQAGYMYHDKLLRAAQVIVTPLAPRKAPEVPVESPVDETVAPPEEDKVDDVAPPEEPQLEEEENAPEEEPATATEESEEVDEGLAQHIDDELTSPEDFQVGDEDDVVHPPDVLEEEPQEVEEFEGAATVVEQMPDIGEPDLGGALDDALDQAVDALLGKEEKEKTAPATGESAWDLSDELLDSELEAALNGNEDSADS